MTEVKRGYSSPQRDRQAAETRRAILDSAHRMFVAQGYGATTIQQIAEGAGVASQTVYAVFGNKKAVLGGVLDVAIAGDDEPVAVNDREWMRAVYDDPDARARLRAYASAVAGIHARAGDVFAVVDAAAAADPRLVPLATTAAERRRTGAAGVIAGLDALGVLRSDLDQQLATDILWTLNGPDLYARLVRDCGWSLDAYERWIAATMIASLLGDG